jgi:RimJ/RimL family protein N-acetyltransferase
MGLPLWPFGVWTSMHHLRVFANREYSLLLIYRGDRLLHRSGVFPRYRRFPFMAEDDLQIGDVWTDAANQNRGLASFAIQQILRAKAKPGRSIWYIVDAANLSSIRIVEKLGFLRVGVGARSKRPGFGLLDQFVIDRCEETGESGR